MKRRNAYVLGMATMVLSFGEGPAEAQQATETKDGAVLSARSFYDHQVQTIDGRTVGLSGYKGKVCLVVNTASQ